MSARIIDGPNVGRWICHQMNATYAGQTAIGLERNNKIVAGIMYENFNGFSMLAHIAIIGRATPYFFWFNAQYVFHQCKIHKLIASVSSGNTKSMMLVEKIGFREEHRIHDADPSGDLIIYTLTEANCRFLQRRAYRQAASPCIPKL